MKIKSAIIGLGNIGMGYDYGKRFKSYLTHSSSLKSHRDYELVGAAERNLNKRLYFEKKYKVRTYNSIDLLLKDKDFELVIVANNFKNNVKIFKKIAKKKSIKFILFEKPFIKTSLEAKKVSAIARKYNKSYAINFQRNFNKKYTEIISKIPLPSKKNFLNITIFYSKNFLNNATHYLFLIWRFLSNQSSIIKVRNSIIIKQKYSTIQLIKIDGNFSYNNLLIFNNNCKFEFTSRDEKCIIYQKQDDRLYKNIKILKKKKEIKLEAEKNQKFVLDNISEYLNNNNRLHFKKNMLKNYLKILTKIEKQYEKI